MLAHAPATLREMDQMIRPYPTRGDPLDCVSRDRHRGRSQRSGVCDRRWVCHALVASGADGLAAARPSGYVQHQHTSTNAARLDETWPQREQERLHHIRVITRRPHRAMTRLQLRILNSRQDKPTLLDMLIVLRPRRSVNALRQSAVDGSMTAETLEMRSAGNAPQRACSSRMSSSGAT
jgi:hypothetical protein